MSKIKEQEINRMDIIGQNGNDGLHYGEVHPIVEQMEKEWPQMTTEFKRLQKEQYELFCRKQHDYGPGNISVGTQLKNAEEIKLSLTGLWFRMNDKVQRLKQLVVLGKQDNVGEACEDTFQDLSVYGIIAQLVASGKWAK